MDLVIPNTATYADIKPGDILVIEGKPYLVRIDHGVGTDALLLGLSGKENDYYAYFDLNSLVVNVSEMKDVQHYKASEFELRLFKK